MQPPYATSESTPQGEDRSVRVFWAMLAAFVALWTIVPTVSQPSLPLDTIEMLHWGNEWQWGYYKHPPLPAWIAQLTSMAFGTANWPMYLIPELATAASFWAVWRLGRELVSPWLALCSVAVLQGCYLFNWSTPELNNNTITRPFWALAVLMLYWALTRKQLRYWIGYAVAISLGLYSKYDVLFLGAGVTWLLLWNAQARQAWRTAGPYVAAAIIAGLLAPHAKWLVENDFPTLHYAVGRADDHDSEWADHVVNPLIFAAKQAPLVLPVLMLAIPIVGVFPARRSLRDDERLGRDLLIASSLVPCLLLVGYCAYTGSKLRTGWTSQIWTHLGLLAFYAFELRSLDRTAILRTLKWSGFFCALALAVMPLRNNLSPLLRGKTSRIHYPGRQLADAVETIWHDAAGAAEVPVVAAHDWWTAANVGFYADGRPATLNLDNAGWTPWSSDAAFARTGGVLIEQVADPDVAARDMAANWRSRFPNAGVCQIVTIPWDAPGEVKPATFLVLPVPPQTRTAARIDADTLIR